MIKVNTNKSLFQDKPFQFSVFDLLNPNLENIYNNF